VASFQRLGALAMLLSALCKLPWKRSARNVGEKADRRRDERYDAYHPVTIRMSGMPPVAGTLISVSLGGAAIRFHGWIAEVPEPWLTALNRGDEVRLEGLTDTQASCQIVTTEAGVLRVQFAPDDAMRRELRSMVGDFTGPPLATRVPDRPLPGQRTPRAMRERSSV
jgi:hypothetical protein